MTIQCSCGKFRAELMQFPKNTPGRLKCYCDDCQAYLKYLNRTDLLDVNGGTEIIPAYPAEVKNLAGKEFLKCTRLHAKGMYRYSTTCCNTPIVNTEPGRPWAGFHRTAYKDGARLEKELGPIKASIMGKYAKGTPPKGTPQKFNFKGMMTVLPFILRGILTGKSKPSPFFENGQSIVAPKILSEGERESLS